MIREFETAPEYDCAAESNFRWTNKISVDLAWVGAASPFGDWTQIMPCGSGCWTAIKIPYSAFMALWSSQQ